MANISITTDADKLAKKISKLSNNLQKEIDQKVQKALNNRITTLKSELDFLINQYATVPGTSKDLTAQPLAQKIAEDQAFQKSVTVDYGDAFHTNFGDNVYKASTVNTRDGGTSLVMRVRDTNMHPDSTYKDYVDSFSSTLTDKVFAIQDGIGGSYRYYIIPPGSPLLDEVLDGVKIFCSEYTDQAGRDRDLSELGDDGETLKDIGKTKGQEKFERDKKKGHTEFSLKGETLELIKQRGKDVTNIVTNTQHGDFQSASTLAEKHTKNSAMKQAFNKALQASEGKNISPEAKALTNTNKAISNINIKKSVSRGLLKYSIQTAIDNKNFISDEVIHAVKRESLIWSKSLEGPLRTAIEEAFKIALKHLDKGA